MSVVYGPRSDPARYTAQGCFVAAAGADEAVLSCITVPGTGGDLFWAVTVGGQAAPAVGPSAYGWPVVASFAGDAAAAGDTEGGQVVVIVGANFGPMGTTINATYIAR